LSAQWLLRVFKACWSSIGFRISANLETKPENPSISDNVDSKACLSGFVVYNTVWQQGAFPSVEEIIATHPE